MKHKLFFAITLLLGSVCSSFAQSKGGRELNAYEIGKLPGQVYLFGFSQAFGDSVAYVTEVCKIDSVMLQKKTKFLPFRNEFSIQMKEYLEGRKGLKLQTACVFYSKSKTKAQKRLAKMKKRCMNMENTIVETIKTEDFQFIHPLDRFASNK